MSVMYFARIDRSSQSSVAEGYIPSSAPEQLFDSPEPSSGPPLHASPGAFDDCVSAESVTYEGKPKRTCCSLVSPSFRDLMF